MQIIVQRLAFAQEFGRKNKVVALQLLPEFGGVADRNGGFDDHHRLRIDALHVPDHRLDGFGVEVVGLGIVIGGRSDDDVFCTGVGLALVQGGLEVQFLVRQIVFDFHILDGRLLAVKHLHFLGDDVDGHDLIVLGKQHGVGEADVAGSGDCDFHDFFISKKGQTAKLDCDTDNKQANFPAPILHFSNPTHYAASLNRAANAH